MSDNPVRSARRRWKGLPFWLRLLVLGGAAFVSGLAFVNYLAMPLIVHGAAEVKVPDVTGLPLEDAESALAEQGLTMSEAGAVYDSQVPEGRVVKQEPGPGTSVRKARAVAVIVSRGPDVATVPQLEGESLRHARMLLRRVGLAPGEVARSYSAEVPADYVIGTDPPGGASLPKGAKVSLLVSLGPRTGQFIMPDLGGLPIRETAYQLEALGFSVELVGRGWRAAPRSGQVEEQRPLPGKRVRRGDGIQLAD